MGMYLIDCPECSKPHYWFSGNTFEQRCSTCLDAATAMSKAKMEAELTVIVGKAKTSTFKLLQLPYGGPEAEYECPCGARFWIDATVEENLYFDGHELRAQCPQCGLKEIRS